MKKLWVVLVMLVVFVVGFLGGCEREPFHPTSGEIHIGDDWHDYGVIEIVHDEGRGVTCYVWMAGTGEDVQGGISCLADWTLLKPAPEVVP
jgi:hypothetical protein